MTDWMTKEIEEKEILLKSIRENGYLDIVNKVGEELANAIRNGNKILLAGNGGSAADAQHFAGEIVGRFLMERKAMPAISLCVDPVVVTCIGNDYGYDEVFARQIQGLGCKGDVFIGISTSGNSENIIKAIHMAKEREMLVVGFAGKNGGKMKEFCDYALVVPSDRTARIQEMHTFTVHLLCEMIEKEIFK